MHMCALLYERTYIGVQSALGDTLAQRAWAPANLGDGARRGVGLKRVLTEMHVRSGVLRAACYKKMPALWTVWSGDGKAGEWLSVGLCGVGVDFGVVGIGGSLGSREGGRPCAPLGAYHFDFNLRPHVRMHALMHFCAD